MLIKEFLKLIQALPQEAELHFQIGLSERERDNLAKFQLRRGEALCSMGVCRIEFYQSRINLVDGHPGFVTITIDDEDYSIHERQETAAEFDELTDGIKLFKY